MNQRPFPVAPTFDATPYDRRVFRATMCEAWLDRADYWLAEAQEALGAGNHEGAELALRTMHDALCSARSYMDREPVR